MFDAILGNLIGGAFNLAGGMMSENAAQKERGIQLNASKEVIQNRVKDSLAAGVHPLFGLGASVSSPAPVVTGQTGEGLRDAGQNVSRAVEAYASGSERAMSKQMQALQLQRMGLENTLISEQIRSEQNRRVGSPPAFPETLRTAARVQASTKVPGQGSGIELRQPVRTTNMKTGVGYETNPNFVDAQSIEDRYGDNELLSMLTTLVNGAADAGWNYAKSPYRWDRSTKKVLGSMRGRPAVAPNRADVWRKK